MISALLGIALGVTYTGRIRPEVLRFVVVYALYVAIVNTTYGPWTKWRSQKLGAGIDGWTLTHIVWGGLARRMGLTPREITLLSIANEAVEYWIRTYKPHLLWGEPESLRNIGVDLLANMVGYYMTPAPQLAVEGDDDALRVSGSGEAGAEAGPDSGEAIS